MPKTINETFTDLAALVDAWCDRRAIAPLCHFLPAYSTPYHTDQWYDLRDGLQKVLAFARPELVGDEERRVADAIAAIDTHLRASLGPDAG